MRSRPFFILIGLCNIAVALLHFSFVLGSDPNNYFCAPPKLIALAKAGSWMPSIATVLIAIGFLICSAYAFSAAKLTRRLPLLKTEMFFVGALFTIRGLFAIPSSLFALGYFTNTHQHMLKYLGTAGIYLQSTGASDLAYCPAGRAIVFSLAFLLLGIFHLIGFYILATQKKSG